MGLLAFVLAGLVVGVIARGLFPGKNGMGLVGSALFGLTGAFFGGLTGVVIYGNRLFELNTGGILGIGLAVFIGLFLLGVRAKSRRGAPF